MILTGLGILTALAATGAEEPIDIGSRLELMVDDFLIDRMTGAELRLHHPQPQETAIVFDEPWEGSACGYVTVFEDEGLYRMYYKAWHLDVTGGELKTSPLHIAYAESDDGIVWRKPELGLFEFEGSTANNIVWYGPPDHGFSPFRDPNPKAPPEARYKAFGHGQIEAGRGVFAFASPDGIHWSLMHDEPVLTGCAFDSQNLAFWDSFRGEYRAYMRDFREGFRDIKTATSPDFVHWTQPQWLQYPGAPDEALYTNQVRPYHRAPHIFIGMPARYCERGWSPSMEALPEPEHRRMRSDAGNRYGMAITDSLLMTSRDGGTFRRWGEAFVRPGIQRPGAWAYGDHYLQWGLVETPSKLPGAANELSLYSVEGYWTGTSSSLRRYTLRIDGFVSVHAALSGGEMLTRPLTFDGERLVLNFSTSAAGGIRVEIQDANGEAIEGFTLDDSDEVFGDEIERTVTWRGGESDVSALSGRPVRLRFVLRDADLYSLRFM
ncbi:MAG: hypothetical protein ACP5KN_11495 [Armatimonadota bacterium]